MKTLWALVGAFVIISKAGAVQVSTAGTAAEDDKVHHKRQLNNFLGGYPGYPLGFPYRPIDLGEEFDFYRSHLGWGGYEGLLPYDVGPLGPNGLYPDLGQYANRFNYLPPPPPFPPPQGSPAPPQRPPPPPPQEPEPSINLNANPIIVDDGGNDLIKEIPPNDPGLNQKIPYGGAPNYNNLRPPVYTNTPLNRYPDLPGSNDYLPPPNINQFGYFPNYYDPGFLGLPRGAPDAIPVREPAGPEPFYVPPQLYHRPAVSNPTPILPGARNRTANTLVPTAPVSLGSGSLGIVRLNNGQYALGSGSLGYVGNVPFPVQTYLPQPPLQQELYPGLGPQTFADRGYGQRQDGQQQTSQATGSGSSNNNQQQGVQSVIKIDPNRRRPLFGPVQIAPGPGPGGYGFGNDGRLGFLPTNLYQDLPSIQHLGEPGAINNSKNKYNLQPLQLEP